MESFKGVIASIQKNKDREFNLLLGNGFSMAYDPKIFSYNALHDFISNEGDSDLSKVMGVIESKNFEEIMRYLDKFLALAEAFGDKSDLKKRVRLSMSKLKKGLLDAVQSLHPEHVFAVPEEQHKNCANFLNHFLKTNGKIFSANYDLLLYWVLMRANEIKHCDGFGRDLLNPEEVNLGEDQQWSELRWGKNREEQNVFYLHGALPFFDTGVEIEKEEYGDNKFLLENVSARMERGEYPVFVTAGDGRQKLEHIMHNRYLSFCYEKLCGITGSLVTFGFNFGSYDEHFIEAINKAAKHGKKTPDRLWSIYIGVYSDADKAHIEKISDKFMCKVHIYDAKSVDVWGPRE